MIAKAGLGLVGLGAIGIGSVAFTKPEWLGINKEIPWTPLSQDKDFNTSSYSDDKFGGKYKNYLTGIKGKEEGDNNTWWQKSYEQWTKDNRGDLGNGFKDEIKGGIRPATGSADGDKYLKEVCDTIYKVAHGNIVASPGTTETDKYKEAEVWKYCSPLGQKPQTIKDTDTNKSLYQQPISDKDPIGKDEGNRAKLISTTGNEKFWEIREKEFRGKDGYKRIEENADAFFNPDSKQAHIKDLCEEAYGKSKDKTDNSTDAEPNKDKVLKYCSLDKSSN